MTDQDIDKKFTFTDKFKNQFRCRNRKITLNHSRDIGKIVSSVGLLIYSKPEKTKDIFHRWNAWSIPEEILKRVDKVVFYTSDAIYRITTAQAKARGKYLDFKESGIELKIYVPLKHWDKQDLIEPSLFGKDNI